MKVNVKQEKQKKRSFLTIKIWKFFFHYIPIFVCIFCFHILLNKNFNNFFRFQIEFLHNYKTQHCFSITQSREK